MFSVLEVISIRKNYALVVRQQHAGVQQTIDGKNLPCAHIKNIGAKSFSIGLDFDGDEISEVGIVIFRIIQLLIFI